MGGVNDGWCWGRNESANWDMKEKADKGEKKGENKVGFLKGKDEVRKGRRSRDKEWEGVLQEGRRR